MLSTWLCGQLDGGPGDLDVLLPGAGHDPLEVGLGLGDRSPWRRGRRSGPCRSRWRRSSAAAKSRSVRAMAASASFILASASSTAAWAGGMSSGRGARLELVELGLGRRPARPRAPPAAPCSSRSSIRNSGSPGLDLVALLDEDLGDHARDVDADRDVLLRRLDQPRPGDHLDAVGPGRRLDDGRRRRRGLPRLDDRVDREDHARPPPAAARHIS